MESLVKAALFGVAVGDALGVPVEFTSRESLKANPVTDMRAFGSHRQPAGTFSDDGSLTFCLAASMAEGFSLEDTAQRFDAIPAEWVNVIARKDDIEQLAQQIAARYA